MSETLIHVETYSEYIANNYKKLLNYITKCCKNIEDAEDILADIWLMSTKLDEYWDKTCKKSTLIYAVARNKYLTLARKRRRERLRYERLDTKDNYKECLIEHFALDLDRANLDEDECMILDLYTKDCFNTRQILNYLQEKGWSYHGAYATINSTRKKIKEILGE